MTTKKITVQQYALLRGITQRAITKAINNNHKLPLVVKAEKFSRVWSLTVEANLHTTYIESLCRKILDEIGSETLIGVSIQNYMNKRDFIGVIIALGDQLEPIKKYISKETHSQLKLVYEAVLEINED